MELEKVINPRVTFAGDHESEPDVFSAVSDALIALGMLIIFLENFNHQSNGPTVNLSAIIPITYGVFLGILPKDNVS